jgi:hypothetical protein
LKYKRKIIVAISDSHSGHKFGLTNPETPLNNEEGITYPQLSETQQYLWDLYSNAVQEIQKLAGKDEVYVFHLGDLTQGMKYLSEQTSTRMSDQFILATYALHPLMRLRNLKALRIAMGTPSHEFGEGTSDIVVEKLLQAQFPKVNIRTLYHGLCSVDNLTIDYAHHGPRPASREWLQGNDARYYLRNIMNTSIKRGEMPPSLVWRGHYHTYIKETLGMSSHLGYAESTLYVLPSMSMLGDYGRQATASISHVTNGLLAFEVLDDKIYTEHKYMNTLDIRVKESL